MNTTLQILQGTGQIGGNIILIDGKKSRLIIDFGIPLTEIDGTPINLNLNNEHVKNYLPDIPDLYKNKQNKETLIILSHCHPDHFGLLRFLNKSIPIYTTKATKELLQKSSKILYNNLFEELNIIEIQETLYTPDFIIDAFPVDHSIAGACAFRIIDKKSGQSIVYSGDLRTHGRNNIKIKNFIKNNTNNDFLILEGTTLSRTNNNCTNKQVQKIMTEIDVEHKMAEIFSQDKMSIVCCSPLNIDRIISLYNACKKIGKTLVIDPYTAYILETFSQADIPCYKSENLKVYCAYNSQTKNIFKDKQYKKFGQNKICFEEIMKKPNQFVIKDNHKITTSITKRISIKNINFIYSYWDGYLENRNNRWNKYISQLYKVHVSGHIVKSELINLVNKLSPKNIIPIHTLANDKFKEYFKEKVIELNKDNILEIKPSGFYSMSKINKK